MKEKGILIIGEGRTGKTHIARCIAQMFGEYQEINAHQRKTYFEVNELSKIQHFFNPNFINAKCLIVDEIKVDDLEEVYNWQTEGVYVRIKYESKVRIIIHPKIILTVNDKPENTPAWASLHSRFEIIKLISPFPSELITKNS